MAISSIVMHSNSIIHFGFFVEIAIDVIVLAIAPISLCISIRAAALETATPIAELCSQMVRSDIKNLLVILNGVKNL